MTILKYKSAVLIEILTLPLYENSDDYKKGKKVIMKVIDVFENCKYN